MAITRHFSDYLTSLASLVGIPPTRISTELAGVFSTLFNTAVQDMWEKGPWLEVCPNGEARFAGNRLSYCNDLSKTASWTATAVTLTPNSVQNPADGSTTASKMMEGAANSAHKVVQTVTTFYPSTNYRVSFYGRPNGRSFVQLAVTDGVTTYTAFFDLVNGVVGTTSNFLTTTIGQQPNGFWLCQATFTANAAATTAGSYTMSLSNDGSTLSYAGDTSKGVYLWGNLVAQTSNVPLNDSVIAWDQAGENVIEAIFELYANSPYATYVPTRLTYQPVPAGIQIINASPVQFNYYINGVAQQSIYGAVPCNPVFLYYRKAVPNYSGAAYSTTATYAVDQQMYFTNSIGNGDYYICLVATSAGQSPDTTPASWSVLTVYDTFFQYAIYRAYADWLLSDGQNDKSGAAEAMAQRVMDDKFDVRERQMGDVLPMRTQTHVTAQQRWS